MARFGEKAFEGKPGVGTEALQIFPYVLVHSLVYSLKVGLVPRKSIILRRTEHG
jgi:hypothetical protein